jgi:uncharacterized membrane protein
VKKLSKFLASRLVAGVFVVAPIYLTVLLLLKVMKSLSRLVQPFVKLLPEWLPADRILSLLLVLFVCFLIGVAVRTPIGRTAWARVENSLFRRVPGYELFRGFTQRLSGEAHDQTWEPALAEIEEALVPAFIVEELKDGRFAVFVPAVPTPFTGAIYILTPDRVHPLNIPLTHAIKVVSQWGSGCKDLIAAMETSKISLSGTGRDGVRTLQ